MHRALPMILEIQELDMQMIQLMRLKRERQLELEKINVLRVTLQAQVAHKEHELTDLKKNIRMAEGEIAEVVAKFKKLESQQSSVKKVEEFNALSQEMSQMERERVAKEQRLSDLYDRLAAEEEVLKSLQERLAVMIVDNKNREEEILEKIGQINEEGRVLKTQRDSLVKQAEPDVFKIYDRLLHNKKDRVVVPIENRCCSGCHILLTAQDENLVRKGEHLVFCEHCSRIHFWQESAALEGSVVATKQRRRRTTTKV